MGISSSACQSEPLHTAISASSEQSRKGQSGTLRSVPERNHPIIHDSGQQFEEGQQTPEATMGTAHWQPGSRKAPRSLDARGSSEAV